jgi:flagellar hook-length control protein FliK
VSSVASGSSVVASLLSFQTTRGPSAQADNTAEQPTPFSMLLDANTPSPDKNSAPVADRPARPDSPPHPAATDDRRADAAPQSSLESTKGNDTQGARYGKAEAGSSKDGNAANGAKESGAKDTVDGKDGSNATAGDAGATDQNAADSTGACAQTASAQIVAGPAIAPLLPAADATPTQPNSSNDACVAPIASPPAPPILFGAGLDGAAASETATTAQDTPDGQSPGVGNQTAETAVQGTSAKISATPTAQTGTIAPADGSAPAEPVTPPGVTATTTPAEPAKKTAPVANTASNPPADASAPANETTPSTPATAGAKAKPDLKAAAIEVAAPAAGNVKAQAKSQDDPGSAHADSANTNANPLTAAANGQPAKTDGTKSEGEGKTANGHAHRAAAEQISSIDPKLESSSQIADSAVAHAHTDSALLSNPAVPAPQIISATPIITAPAIVAAIPLANLPVEIAAKAKDGINRFDIRLDPPELGRIDVRLDIDRNGHVTSRLMVERPETLDLLRRDAPQIERALQDAGLKTSDQGMQFSLRDQSFADQTDSLPPAASLVLPQDDIVPLEAMRQGYGSLIGLGGGIDIRV